MKTYEIRQRRTGELLGTISTTENSVMQQATCRGVTESFWELRTNRELRAIFLDVECVLVPAKAAGAAG